MLVQVSLALNLFESLSYHYRGDPAILKPGLRVLVPVGNRLTPGWIVETQSSYQGRAKDITAVVGDEYEPDPGYMEFTRAVSRLYFVSQGSLLEASLPPKRKPIGGIYFENKEKEGKIEKVVQYPLARLQQLGGGKPLECFYKVKPATPHGMGDLRRSFGPSLGALNGAPGLPVISSDTTKGTPLIAAPNSPDSSDDSHHSSFIIHHSSLPNPPLVVEGIKLTGSSPEQHRLLIAYDREIYYRQMIDETLRQGKSVLITVPDNLTALYLKEKLQPQGIAVDIYNSEIKPKERDALWEDYVLRGKVGVVVGGQSAVLLPIRNLGLILCERAGAGIYKRRYYSTFDAHILSQQRAKSTHLPLEEGFSTYTVQSRQKPTSIVSEDKRETITPIEVHMIKTGTRGIPENFQELVSRYYIENKKILVVLNKKESAHFLFCEKCKKIQRCPRCEGIIEVSVEEEIRVTCRRCGPAKEPYRNCPKCGEPFTLIEDISISSVKKLIRHRMAETGITTLSSEGLKTEQIPSVMEQVRGSKIVIATPVIVNPYFKNIFDAVIYLRPESLFHLEEYDGAEKIFSLASEFREVVKPGGSIDIFSTFHFHYALKLVNEEEGFFERELKYREWFHLPPYYNVYNIGVRGKEIRKLAAEMRGIYRANKEALKIKRIYLVSRQPGRGKYKYKGILEAHARPEALLEAGLLSSRDVTIELVSI